MSPLTPAPTPGRGSASKKIPNKKKKAATAAPSLARSRKSAAPSYAGRSRSNKSGSKKSAAVGSTFADIEAAVDAALEFAESEPDDTTTIEDEEESEDDGDEDEDEEEEEDWNGVGRRNGNRGTRAPSAVSDTEGADDPKLLIRGRRRTSYLE
jgi:hypothetical protein